MFLEISAEGKSFRITKFTANAKYICDYSGTDAARGAKALGVAEFIVASMLQNPATKRFDLLAPPTCNFYTRLEIGDEKRQHDTFAEAFAAVNHTHVIEWGCKRTSCCFDMDYPLHMDVATEHMRYHSSVWPSRTENRFHAMYHARNGYEAIELAAMDAYRIQIVYPDAKIELISKTRMPAQGVAATIHEPKEVNEFLEEQSAGSWLLNMGYVVGQRIPHRNCPVNPSPRSEGKAAEPIVMREHYVHCYICESDGVKRGSKHPGRFPYSVLANDHRPTKLSVLVDNLVHYGHAKYVVQNLGVTEPAAQALYSGLLKSKHGVDDARIPSVFTAGEPIGIVRHRGYWADEGGSPLKLDKASPILKTLPVSQTIDRKGNAISSATQLEWLSQPIELNKLGYLPLHTLNGIQLTQFQTNDIQKVYKVREGTNTPKYVPLSKRLSEEDAWAVIETVFPKVNRKAVTALIVGRGCSEMRVGLPPMLFLTGTTGVVKNGHTQLAAAMCGDTATLVHFKADVDRFDNAFLQAKAKSGFVMFDEFFKQAEEARVTSVQAMQSCLRYDADSQAYLIFKGAVPLGDLPMMVYADNVIPAEVLQHEQIGRRVFRMNLGQPVDWEQPLAESGIFEPRNIRTRGNDDHLMAMDSIVSSIMDKWFTGPPLDFAVCMAELGIMKLNRSPEIEEKNQMIRDLFECVCSRPEIKDTSDKKRWSQAGFKIAKGDSSTDPLLQAFQILQNEREKGTTSCVKVSEVSIAKVIGSPHVVELQVRKHGSKFAMRFVSDDGQTVNQELVNANRKG